MLWLVLTPGQTHSTDTAQHRYTQHGHIVSDNSTKGPGRDFVNFSLVSVIRRWSSAQELSVELFYGAPGYTKKLYKGIKDMREKRMEDKHIACRGRWTHVWQSVCLSVCLLLLVPVILVRLFEYEIFHVAVFFCDGLKWY